MQAVDIRFNSYKVWLKADIETLKNVWNLRFNSYKVWLKGLNKASGDYVNLCFNSYKVWLKDNEKMLFDGKVDMFQFL